MLRRFLLHWLPLLFWMVVIFGASTGLGAPVHTGGMLRRILLWLNLSLSASTFELVHHLIRKTAHAVEYAILGILIWRVVRVTPAFSGYSSGWQFRFALMLAALYAATDETHQIFVPGRQPAIMDVLLDTCGAACGLAIAWFIQLLRRAGNGI